MHVCAHPHAFTLHICVCVCVCVCMLMSDLIGLGKHCHLCPRGGNDVPEKRCPPGLLLLLFKLRQRPVSLAPQQQWSGYTQGTTALPSHYTLTLHTHCTKHTHYTLTLHTHCTKTHTLSSITHTLHTNTTHSHCTKTHTLTLHTHTAPEHTHS